MDLQGGRQEGAGAQFSSRQSPHRYDPDSPRSCGVTGIRAVARLSLRSPPTCASAHSYWGFPHSCMSARSTARAAVTTCGLQEHGSRLLLCRRCCPSDGPKQQAADEGGMPVQASMRSSTRTWTSSCRRPGRSRTTWSRSGRSSRRPGSPPSSERRARDALRLCRAGLNARAAVRLGPQESPGDRLPDAPGARHCKARSRAAVSPVSYARLQIPWRRILNAPST